MRKQLEEIKEIDQYILHQLTDEDRLLLDAKMILSPVIRRNWWQQLKLHKLIRSFGRQEKRKELQAIHNRLMNNPAFAQEIQSIFK